MSASPCTHTHRHTAQKLHAHTYTHDVQCPAHVCSLWRSTEVHDDRGDVAVHYSSCSTPSVCSCPSQVLHHTAHCSLHTLPTPLPFIGPLKETSSSGLTSPRYTVYQEAEEHHNWTAPCVLLLSLSGQFSQIKSSVFVKCISCVFTKYCKNSQTKQCKKREYELITQSIEKDRGRMRVGVALAGAVISIVMLITALVRA